MDGDGCYGTSGRDHDLARGRVVAIVADVGTAEIPVELGGG